MNTLHRLFPTACCLLLLLYTGCSAHPYGRIQFRMTEPMVAVNPPASAEGGNDRRVASLDPPTILFKKFRTRTGVDDKKYISVIAQKPWPEYRDEVPQKEKLFLQPLAFGNSERAFFVWDNPNVHLKNWVDLEYNAIYRMAIVLPERYELRRLQLLQAKAETLYKAIDIADDRLQKYSQESILLLSEEVRAAVLEDIVALRGGISEIQLALHGAESEEDRAEAASQMQSLTEQILENEKFLRRDDIERDKALAPTLIDSLSNKIEEYRSELEKIKARIVALELMVQNPNEPYPRVIHGWLETLDESPFTRIGSIPFAIEDEYLDWIRQGKNVTMVFYDPNVRPGDPRAAAYRRELPEFWPSDNLAVFEFKQAPVASYRAASGGTGTGTAISREVYFDVTATTFRDRTGYTRTYLQTRDERKMWVFGPDLRPPGNVEVWTLDKVRGAPQTKLYPIDPVGESQGDVFVRQIAGVEGGAYDPIDEAMKRGQIVAIGFLGNWRTQHDARLAHTVYEYFVNNLVPGVDIGKQGNSLGRIYQAEGQAHRIYQREQARSN